MSNVGSGSAGQTLIGDGTGKSPTFKDIGTNSGLTARGVVIAEGSGAFQATAAGTSGQVLQSGGAGSNPSYSTATYPSSAGSSGNVITSNGTNFTSSPLPSPPGTTLTNHSIALGTGTANLGSVGPSSTAGTIVQSAGSSADPVFSTATYPSTASSAGKILRADGTNWSASTATYPNTATGTGTILRADGTNWVASTATYPNTVNAGDAIYGSASNVFSTLSLTGIPGSHMIYDGSNLVAYNPGKHIILYDDFFSGNSFGNLTWATVTVNGASVTNNQTSSTIYQGVSSINISTTASSAVVARLGQNSTTDNPLIIGQGSIYLHFICKLSALSDATDTYKARIGILTQTSGTDPQTYGIFFEYTHGTNSGKWTITCVTAGTGTTNNTNSTVDTNFHKFGIKINSAGSSVSFYIDDVEVTNSPITTNIPTSGQLFPGLQILRTAGSTNARNLYVDQFYFFENLNSAR